MLQAMGVVLRNFLGVPEDGPIVSSGPGWPAHDIIYVVLGVLPKYAYGGFCSRYYGPPVASIVGHLRIPLSLLCLLNFCTFALRII